MLATITYTNYSKDIKVSKEYKIPSNITVKTAEKFEKISDSLMTLAEIEECEDYGCEVEYKSKKYSDIFELLEHLQ